MRSAEEIAGEIIPDSDGFGEWPHYVADRRPLIAKAIREARAEGRAEALGDVAKALAQHRCGDSSCIFGSRGGMQTNGGCRDLKNGPQHVRLLLQRVVADIRALVERSGGQP
jgi:hypothetical protein